MDHFASVWDVAGDEAEVEQGLRALTSARIQVAPLWGFLAASQTRQEFGHRFALVEDQVRTAADQRGVTLESLAKSLADDFYALEASRKTGAYYVKDGDKEVGGPYDSKADAQDAIDGGDVSGDNLSVSKGDGGDDSDDDGDDDSGDDDSDDDGDSGGGNPFAKKDDGSDDDPDDDASDDDGKGDNPFAKKAGFPAGAPAGADLRNRAFQHGVEHGTFHAQQGRIGSPHIQAENVVSGDSSYPAEHRDVAKSAFAEGYQQAITPHTGAKKQATATVVHQPGETVFVDHFMGHDEHEGRKGVWATVVKSPGQHPYADRADSHLLKPMAPGGTHFFHHFGGLGKTAHTDADVSQAVSERANSTGSNNYPHGWKPYAKPSAGHNLGEMPGNHPIPPDHMGGDSREHAHTVLNYRHDALNSHEPNRHCDDCGSSFNDGELHMSDGDRCPGCGAHESRWGDDDGHDYSSDFDDPHYGPNHEHSEDNYGDPYGRHDQRMEGSRKTALPEGVDPLQWIVETVPGGQGQPEAVAHHEGRTATIVERFRSLRTEFSQE